MKVRLSVLLSGISGKSGDVVGSNWKGRAYVRRRVIPANPQTQKQQDQRNALARLVECFQALTSREKTFLDKLGADEALSGYNVYVGRNISEEKQYQYHPIIPSNRYVDDTPAVTLEGGPSSGELVLKFSDRATWEHDSVDVWIRGPSGEDFKFDAPWTRHAQNIQPSSGDYTISGLENGQYYAVCYAWNAADDPATELLAGKGYAQSCQATM